MVHYEASENHNAPVFIHVVVNLINPRAHLFDTLYIL